MKYSSTLIYMVAFITPGLTQVDLGTAISYGALAVTGITNTGLTIVDGNIGTSGAEIVGFPPGQFTGTTGTGTPATVQGRADAKTAYNEAQGLSGGIFTNPTLDNQTLLAGIYAFNTSVTLAGNLTLDGAGDSSATWVFQIPGASTLTTAALSQVVLINGASGCNIYWAVGTSATLGAASFFSGNILANVSISVTTAASINGGLFANAAITLENNQVNVANCGAPNGTASPTSSGTISTSIPPTTLSSSVTPTSTPTVTSTSSTLSPTVSSGACPASTTTVTAAVTDTVTATQATTLTHTLTSIPKTVTTTDTVTATTTIFKNCVNGVSLLGICLL